jgi:hypothetical protein
VVLLISNYSVGGEGGGGERKARITYSGGVASDMDWRYRDKKEAGPMATDSIQLTRVSTY